MRTSSGPRKGTRRFSALIDIAGELNYSNSEGLATIDQDAMLSKARTQSVVFASSSRGLSNFHTSLRWGYWGTSVNHRIGSIRILSHRPPEWLDILPFEYGPNGLYRAMGGKLSGRSSL